MQQPLNHLTVTKLALLVRQKRSSAGLTVLVGSVVVWFIPVVGGGQSARDSSADKGRETSDSTKLLP